MLGCHAVVTMALTPCAWAPTPRPSSGSPRPSLPTVAGRWRLLPASCSLTFSACPSSGWRVPRYDQECHRMSSSHYLCSYVCSSSQTYALDNQTLAAIEVAVFAVLEGMRYNGWKKYQTVSMIIHLLFSRSHAVECQQQLINGFILTPPICPAHRSLASLCHTHLTPST